jgi:hypothetical protein
MKKKKRIVCNITKEIIESLDTYETDEFLNSLLRPGGAREFQDSLEFGISGYTNDQRELWEIPEVRLFMKLIDENFPFLLHFCNKEDETLKWISLSLINLSGENDVFIVKQKDLLDFITNRLQMMNHLHKENNYAKEESMEMARRIVKYFKEKMPVYPQRNG